MGNLPLIVTSKTNPLVRSDITRAAWQALAEGGSPLDAAEKATNVSELDPRDTTVGYGGDPNEQGFLQLDAAVMSGPDGNDAGAVAALQNIRTPSSVARLVMERTDHLMIVGAGALQLARLHGFAEQNLLSDEARAHWLAWKESWSGRSYYRPPRGAGSTAADRSKPEPVSPAKPEGGGTIVVLVVDVNGDIAGAASTVGHHFKIVGRVGDTPIIGAGLYLDNDVGAAGATGHGEETTKLCASFLAVEKMREGMTPQDACRYVCRRAADRYDDNPPFNFKMIALSKSGDYGCCALRGTRPAASGKVTGLGFALHDAGGHRLEDGAAVLPPLSDEQRINLPLR